MEAGFAMNLKECRIRHRRLMYRALNELFAATRALSDRAIEFSGRRTGHFSVLHESRQKHRERLQKAIVECHTNEYLNGFLKPFGKLVQIRGFDSCT